MVWLNVYLSFLLCNGLQGSISEALKRKLLIYLGSDSKIISHVLIPFSLFAKFSQYSWHLKPIILWATGRKRRQDGWSGKWILLTVVLNLPCWKALSCMEAKLCLIPSKQSRQEKGKYINSNRKKKKDQAMQNIKNCSQETNTRKSNKSHQSWLRKRKDCWAEIELIQLNQAAKVSYKMIIITINHTEKTAGSIVLKCEALFPLPERRMPILKIEIKDSWNWNLNARQPLVFCHVSFWKYSISQHSSGGSWNFTLLR